MVWECVWHGDAAAGECMYGACLMAVVLVRVCRCGVLLVR